MTPRGGTTGAPRSPTPSAADDVSVVIPVFNGGRWVGQALDSVQGQTWAPAEVIIVDDGSTDDTPEVLRRYVDWAHVLTVPNGGVARARNLGAEQASRRWLAFLDADDLWLPTRLERQLTALGDSRVALAYCGLFVVDEQLRGLRRMGVPPVHDALANTVLLEPPPVSVAQAALIDRDAFWQVGGFSEDMPPCEDADLVLRLLTQYSAEALDEDLVLYRLHDAQASRDVRAMERGWRLLHERAFGHGLLPSPLERQRGTARANLHASVGAELAARGEWAAAAKHAATAVLADPRQAGRLGSRRLRRVLRRQQSSTATAR